MLFRSHAPSCFRRHAATGSAAFRRARSGLDHATGRRERDRRGNTRSGQNARRTGAAEQISGGGHCRGHGQADGRHPESGPDFRPGCADARKRRGGSGPSFLSGPGQRKKPGPEQWKTPARRTCLERPAGTIPRRGQPVPADRRNPGRASRSVRGPDIPRRQKAVHGSGRRHPLHFFLPGRGNRLHQC